MKSTASSVLHLHNASQDASRGSMKSTVPSWLNLTDSKNDALQTIHNHADGAFVIRKQTTGGLVLSVTTDKLIKNIPIVQKDYPVCFSLDEKDKNKFMSLEEMVFYYTTHTLPIVDCKLLIEEEIFDGFAL